jgi:hypothetical protein
MGVAMPSGPVVQWIELWTSKPLMLVRFQPGPPEMATTELRTSKPDMGVRFPLGAPGCALSINYGECSSTVERPPVARKVAGSFPVTHPKKKHQF